MYNRHLFHIYNKRKNLENSLQYWPSVYVHTQEQNYLYRG